MSARRDIERTLYHFARGFDEDDLDLLVDCLTSDAELISFEGTTSGRDAIRTALRARRDAAGVDGAQPRHFLTNVEIDIESDSTATSRASYVLFSHAGAEIATVSTGTYGDRFVNESGTWRISQRHVNVDRPGS